MSDLRVRNSTAPSDVAKRYADNVRLLGADSFAAVRKAKLLVSPSLQFVCCAFG